MDNSTNSTRAKIYNINGTLVSDVEIKTNSNGNTYALVKVQTNKKVTTVQTYVKAGIEALQGRKAGEAVRLFGTFPKGKDGKSENVFSAMGLSKEKPAAEAAA